MAENILEESETSGIKTVLRNLESLHDINSSFLEEKTPKTPLKNFELEKIVTNALDRIQSISHGSDFDVSDIVELIMPKVRCELHSNDKLKDGIMYIKDILKTNVQQMEAIDQDIAYIYLDLHTIYRKLDRFDDGSRRLSSTKREKLSRRCQESEELQKKSRHYLNNDAKELSAMLVNPLQGPKQTPHPNLDLRSVSRGI